MRSHAKASPAGSTQRQATGLGRFLNAAASAAAFVLLALIFASAAGATQYQRPFKETFGSAAQPTFSFDAALAVDPSTGDLLVADRGTKTISRFNPDGTPAPFAALGSNAIDGKEVNGKPCAQEPASCDRTPQNRLEIAGSGRTQVAVDNSGGITDGDIYVVQGTLGGSLNLVDIFASDGKYLGQLTAAGVKAFKNEPCGVAVDATGAVYIAGANATEIYKYVPSANPPVNADYAISLTSPPGDTVCNLAAGSGPTASSIFGVSNGGNSGIHTFKFDKETGELKYQFADGFGISPIAVDPVTGRVLIPAAHAGGEVGEFDASGESGAVKVGRLVHSAGGLAISNSGDVYVSEPIGNGNPVSIYGAPAVVPTVTADPASNVIGTKATLTGTVNPEGLEVSECFFKYGETNSYGNTAPCEGSIPTDSSPHPVHLNISGLEPNGHTYHYRLFATNENGTEESSDQTLTTAHTVVTEAATGIGTATATLNGTVRPEGNQYTECIFEYGLSSSVSFEHTASCDPSASAIPPDFAPHAVSAVLGGLQKGTTYRFRLVATTSEGTLQGNDLSFTTLGQPQIGEVRALDADQSSATIEAKINPSGFGTSYRFEWGPTASYGNRVPTDFELFAGSGTEPVRVSAKLSGLSAGVAYHYRIVATSPAGTTSSPDQMLETLNSCGLPEGRCFELVSPRDVGPVAIPSEKQGPLEMHFQASLEGSGGLAYVVEAGYPEATKGAEVLYRGTRGASGWSSTQLSTPIVAPNERNGVGSGSGLTEFLSDDLSCGFAQSWQPLTSDPAMRLALEYGGSNLYRINPAGSPDGPYTGVSNLAPENPEAASLTSYVVIGASQDCSKVLFSSRYSYPGIPGIGTSERLYEWDQGTLRNVGIVPGPSGEVVAGATPGTGTNSAIANYQNTFSDDGSRAFFTATRLTSPNPAEIGQKAIFVREDGTTTRDVSLSETATPDKGATYRWATPDGSKVFFTANAGLTEESSPEGTDLYVYDLDGDKLTDVSAYPEAGGAQVAGFIGASQDGSHVYFAARNQLVPGRGNTLAENQSNKTLSIYGESGGKFSFVGTFKEGKEDLQRVLLEAQREWSSRVSPDGRYLLFESSVKNTGYDSGGAFEAYLYDAQGGSQGTVCVSCRQDGQRSVAPTGEFPVGVSPYNVLTPGYTVNDVTHPARSLIVHNGEPRVFFSSPDRLALGAVEGQNNVYEWSHGQVFRLASAREGQQSPGPLTGRFASFVGASLDGSDVYFFTPETLNWEDGDERLSVYDARAGGGFPEPPPPPVSCEAITEGSCQDPAQAGPSAPGAASATFNGPGNPAAGKQKKPHRKKHHRRKRRHSKKHHRRRSRHSKATHHPKSKRANHNRRAGK